MLASFDVDKVTKFIQDNNFPYVKLLFKRDIEDVDINSSEFIELQNELLQEKLLARLMSKQLENGAWQPKEKDEVFTPMQRSTLWTLIQLGFIGLNGSVIPSIAKSFDYIFETQIDKDNNIFVNDHPIWGDFMESHNSTVLWALLRLGFENRKEVKEASIIHLERINGNEGFCTYKKGGFRCAWGLLKNLKFLNEWPESWRNTQFYESVNICQDYLRSYSLAKVDYPRVGDKVNRKWLELSHFKTYYVDIFEGIEILAESGVRNDPVIYSALEVINKKFIENYTWNCELARNWLVKFEFKDKPSPWLSLRGLKIASLLKLI